MLILLDTSDSRVHDQISPKNPQDAEKSQDSHHRLTYSGKCARLLPSGMVRSKYRILLICSLLSKFTISSDGLASLRVEGVHLEADATKSALDIQPCRGQNSTTSVRSLAVWNLADSGPCSS